MSRHIFGMPVLLSMTPLHFLGHNDQKELKHDSVHVMTLALMLASHDAISIVKGTITFLT